MSKHEYDNEPVFYCKACLSLRILDIEGVDGSEFCEECGSVDIGSTTIDNWERMYQAKYGNKYIK